MGAGTLRRSRLSIDPVVFFKLQLVRFFEGIRSERQLIATAGLNLAHCWYLGYALDETLPDHSSLTRIRQRLGLATFERFFETIVDLCQEAGLIWGRELYVDATKVEANADVDSLVPRFYQDAKSHVADLFAADLAPDDHDDDDAADPALRDDVVSPESVVPLPVSVLFSATVAALKPAPRWQLLEERRLDPHRPAVGSDRRTTDLRVSTTDPDATPLRTGSSTALDSHDQYVVDGGKRRIILAALVTPADVMENVPLRDLLWRVCFRRRIWPHHVTGDAKYGTTENIVAIEDAGIRAYLPLTDFAHRTGFYGHDDFIFDSERDGYRCPQDHPLRRYAVKRTEGVVAYRGEVAICNACPVKAKCTTSDHGRKVQRSFYIDYLEKIRGYHQTEAYKKAIRKRQVWVEPLFAEAKEWHGLRRLRLRGLMNANIQGLLIAAGQNLKRFLAATGWGRRHTPCGGLLALPRESWRLVIAFD